MNNTNVLQTILDFREIANRMAPSFFALALAASLIAAFVASALYRFFYESRGTGSQVNRSFPLLGISITTLFIGVQVSLPLSLGLLGALSIIRFRTPIKEPEEIGFIMLVIAASISCATFNFQFLVILYVFAVVALCISRGVRAWKYFKRDGILVVTVPDAEADGLLDRLDELLVQQTGNYLLESSSSRDGITSVQVAFSRLKTDVAALQEGLRKLALVRSVNIFLDRPGGIR